MEIQWMKDVMEEELVQALELIWEFDHCEANFIDWVGDTLVALDDMGEAGLPVSQLFRIVNLAFDIFKSGLF